MLGALLANANNLLLRSVYHNCRAPLLNLGDALRPTVPYLFLFALAQWCPHQLDRCHHLLSLLLTVDGAARLLVCIAILEHWFLLVDRSHALEYLPLIEGLVHHDRWQLGLASWLPRTDARVVDAQVRRRQRDQLFILLNTALV